MGTLLEWYSAAGILLAAGTDTGLLQASYSELIKTM